MIEAALSIAGALLETILAVFDVLLGSCGWLEENERLSKDSEEFNNNRSRECQRLAFHHDFELYKRGNSAYFVANHTS